MAKVDRIAIYAGAPVTAALAAVDGAGSSNRLNTVAERYMVMVADELERLELTHAEWCAVMEANNGVQVWTGDQAHAGMVWMNVADSEGLGEKWGIDQGGLVRRLRALPRSTLIAIVEACDRFWSRPELPNDAALAAAGIRKTAVGD